jgi:hypothetical protein
MACSEPIRRNREISDSPFLVFQYRGLDVLAVPNKSKAAWLEGVNKLHPYTIRRKIYRAFISCLIRLGGARLAAVNRASPVDDDFGLDFQAWQAHLQTSLGRPIAHVIAVWPTEPSRRRLYVHLLDADLRAFGFVKLAFGNDRVANLHAEAQALQYLHTRQLQTIRVPKLMSHGNFGDVGYLIMEPLPAHVEALRVNQDWDSSGLTAEYSEPSRRLRGAEIKELSWWSNYIENLLPEHQAFHAELMRLLPLGGEVCRAHGDLGPANMVSDGKRTWIFDWESYHSSAPILADPVGFFMSFSVAKISRKPMAHLRKFKERFSADESERRRLAVMLAIAYRHACAIPDAARLMVAWSGR